jgi:peptidoglycan/LPS O-acetylase OafA/YrhL
MGTLRLLLALAVVSAHSYPILGLTLIPAPLAVQAFYIISGFYISLVLGRKYVLDKAGTVSFYVNRYLRLAPRYLVVLLLSAILAWVIGTTIYLPKKEYLDQLSSLSSASVAWVVFTNLFMIGQDTIMFLDNPPGAGSLQWTSNFQVTAFPAYKFLLVPQAWSLGVELWFYMLAPLLVPRRTSFLIWLWALTFLLRLDLAAIGLDYDPWTYRFFPAELGLFLTGILLNRLYFRYRGHWSTRIGQGGFLAVVSVFVAFAWVPWNATLKSWLFLSLFALAVPFVFHWSRNHHRDRQIGELSYPLYTCHLFVAVVFNAKLARYFGPQPGLFVALLALGMAYALYRFVDLPMDQVRERFRASHSTHRKAAVKVAQSSSAPEH